MRTKASIEKQIDKLRTRSTELFHGHNPDKWRMMDTLQSKIIDLWASWHRLDEKEAHDKA